jgi:hypothetical protein
MRKMEENEQVQPNVAEETTPSGDSTSPVATEPTAPVEEPASAEQPVVEEQQDSPVVEEPKETETIPPTDSEQPTTEPQQPVGDTEQKEEEPPVTDPPVEEPTPEQPPVEEEPQVSDVDSLDIDPIVRFDIFSNAIAFQLTAGKSVRYVLYPLKSGKEFVVVDELEHKKVLIAYDQVLGDKFTSILNENAELSSQDINAILHKHFLMVSSKPVEPLVKIIFIRN